MADPQQQGGGGPDLGSGGGHHPGDPPIVSPNIGQLVITVGNTSIGSIALTDDLIDIVRDAGIDPHDIDRMKWPAGASRHASILVLLTQSQLLELQLGAEPDFVISVGVAMGILQFTKMYLRPPIGVMPTANDILYAVPIVDERFFWTKQSLPNSDRAFNVHTDRKMKLVEFPPDSGEFIIFDSLYESTVSSPNEPYTPRQILEILFTGLAPFAAASEFNMWTQFAELDDMDVIRDLVAGEYSIAELIDRVLRASGHVLVAYPYTGYRQDLSESRYNVDRIFEGVIAAEIQLEEFQNNLLGGTMRSAPFGQSDNPPPPNDGFISQLIGEGSLLASEVPARITVDFPQARFDGRYNFNKEADTGFSDGMDYVTERFFSSFYTLPSLIADPPNGFIGVGVANGQNVSIIASYWAVEDQDSAIINEDRVIARGRQIAANYYARFSAGVGNLLFAGLIEIEPWSGALLIEWIINDRGMMTRVSGDLSDSLLGLSVDTSEPLSAASIMTTGTIKALTRPDGGLLLDAPAPPQAGHYIRATITAFDDADNGPFYDAVSNDDPDTISINHDQPRMRLLNHRFYNPAPIGAPCTIIRLGDNYFLWEVAVEAPKIFGCPIGAAEQAIPGDQIPLLMQAHGF